MSLKKLIAELEHEIWLLEPAGPEDRYIIQEMSRILNELKKETENYVRL